MKPTLFYVFFILIIASVNSSAQIPPERTKAVPMVRGESATPTQTVPMVRGESATPPKMRVLSAPAHYANGSGPSNDELKDLLRKQTDALKALSSKLDSIEKRINKVEEAQR